MFKIHDNALSEKGKLRGAVRSAIKAGLGVNLTLSNGSTINLDPQEAGDYFGVIAIDSEGHQIYAKVNVTLTPEAYKAPVKKAAVAKEAIEIE